MSLLGTLVAVAVLLVGVQEFFRRTGQGAAWACFLVLPLLLTPSWDILDIRRQYGLFPLVKLYSMLVLACWLTGVRFTAFGCRRWARFGCTVLAAVNILEAIIQDLLGRSPFHYLNAASGSLLLVAFLYRLDAVEIDVWGGHRDILCESTPRSWVIGYTLWNWVFVYLNYPTFAGHHLALLTSALAVGLVEPRRWGQARVYTLTTYGLLLATFPLLRRVWMDTSGWSCPRGEYLGAAASLVFMVLFTTWFAVASLRRRAEAGLPASPASLDLPREPRQGDLLCPGTTGA